VDQHNTHVGVRLYVLESQKIPVLLTRPDLVVPDADDPVPVDVTVLPSVCWLGLHHNKRVLLSLDESPVVGSLGHEELVFPADAHALAREDQVVLRLHEPLDLLLGEGVRRDRHDKHVMRDRGDPVAVFGHALIHVEREAHALQMACALAV